MSWYCDVAPGHPVHGPYHDREYGFPLRDESALFERLSLEIFQAGLSWLLILKKRPALVSAFDGFSVDTVADYGEADERRLLGDPGIIRNRLKVAAIIENARRIKTLRDTHGGVIKTKDGGKNWEQVFDERIRVNSAGLDPNHPETIFINTFQNAAYRSDNAGESWNRLEGYRFKWGQKAIPDVNNPGMLFLSTYGGSVFYGPADGTPGENEDIEIQTIYTQKLS